MRGDVPRHGSQLDYADGPRAEAQDPTDSVATVKLFVARRPSLSPPLRRIAADDLLCAAWYH
jgi:hypothetical protein